MLAHIHNRNQWSWLVNAYPPLKHDVSDGWSEIVDSIEIVINVVYLLQAANPGPDESKMLLQVAAEQMGKLSRQIYIKRRCPDIA
jgi:hypothetical protein